MTDATLPSPAAPASAAWPTIDPRRYRAAREQCRLHDPDLFFAGFLIDKPRRYALFALDAVRRQLDEILGPPQTARRHRMEHQPAEHQPAEHQPAEHQLDRVALPAAAPAPAAPAGCTSSPTTCTAAGCGSGGCEGESIARRAEVCRAVMDHLDSGLDTGKPELDAYLHVRPAFDLPRELFGQYIAGQAAERTLPRYATWKRLGDVLHQGAGSAALLTARVLLPRHAAVNPTAHGQIAAIGAAMRFACILQQVGTDWRAGRLMIPLDDLIRFGLSEHDIARFTEAGSAAGDARWRRMFDFEVERVGNLLRGGMRALPRLADDGCRRAAAALGVFALKRLQLLQRKGGDPFSTRITLSNWRRLTAMPRAVRIMWNPAAPW